jgi:hypothetical protein
MVIEPPPGIEFVISDNPVSLYSPQTPSFMGAGYLTADVEVTMPLSSHRLLLFSHVDWFQGLCCVTEPAVDHFNSRTWLAAGDYVFASSKAALGRVAALFDPATRRVGCANPVHAVFVNQSAESERRFTLTEGEHETIFSMRVGCVNSVSARGACVGP